MQMKCGLFHMMKTKRALYLQKQDCLERCLTSVVITKFFQTECQSSHVLIVVIECKLTVIFPEELNVSKCFTCLLHNCWTYYLREILSKHITVRHNETKSQLRQNGALRWPDDPITSTHTLDWICHHRLDNASAEPGVVYRLLSLA